MHAHGRVACRRATGLVAEREGDEAEPVRRGRVDGQKTGCHYSYSQVLVLVPRPGRVASSLAKIALPKPYSYCTITVGSSLGTELACPHVVA